MNYQLRSKGYHTIFLGESVPMESLTDILEFFEEVTFLSYFTVYPIAENLSSYLDNFNKLLLTKNNTNLVLLVSRLVGLDESNLPEKITVYNSIENLSNDL